MERSLSSLQARILDLVKGNMTAENIATKVSEEFKQDISAMDVGRTKGTLVRWGYIPKSEHGTHNKRKLWTNKNTIQLKEILDRYDTARKKINVCAIANEMGFCTATVNARIKRIRRKNTAKQNSTHVENIDTSGLQFGLCTKCYNAIRIANVINGQVGSTTEARGARLEYACSECDAPIENPSTIELLDKIVKVNL